MEKQSISSGITGPDSICNLRTNYSASFSDCMINRNLKALGLVYPLSSALSSATGAASGPRAKWIKARPFILPYRISKSLVSKRALGPGVAPCVLELPLAFILEKGRGGLSHPRLVAGVQPQKVQLYI